MFYIIKKGDRNFWHRFNNDTKEVNLSEWQIVLDLIAQSVCLELLNGANIPKNAVSVLEVIVIDETDASTEETFTDVEVLRSRLVALGYNPYVTTDGGATYIEAGTGITITGAGTIGDPYVISASGGGSGGFSKIVVWDGTSTITVPSGFSGTILNYSNGELPAYSVSTTNLTITSNAEAGNILILSS